jgi:hypothetical protein
MSPFSIVLWNKETTEREKPYKRPLYFPSLICSFTYHTKQMVLCFHKDHLHRYLCVDVGCFLEMLNLFWICSPSYLPILPPMRRKWHLKVKKLNNDEKNMKLTLESAERSFTQFYWSWDETEQTYSQNDSTRRQKNMGALSQGKSLKKKNQTRVLHHECTWSGQIHDFKGVNSLYIFLQMALLWG